LLAAGAVSGGIAAYAFAIDGQLENCRPSPSGETVCLDVQDTQDYGYIWSGIGAVAIGTGLYFLLTGPSKGRRADRDSDSAVKPQVVFSPAVGPGWQGAIMNGRF
jgi:hypothetical protein